jgi:putative hydrolase of the HAD superfamily
MSREPQFIYFDLGNVLLHFDHHRAARQMAAVAGLTEETVWQIVFAGHLHNTYEVGGFTTDQFCEEFCRATSTRPDFDALMHAAANIFSLNTPMVPIVSHLHAARYPLGLLSNTNESHWRFVSQGRYALIRDFFDVHALSFRLGAMKPDPRIYAEAAKLAHTEPDRIFFTDDRPENVEAACRAGFDAVQFHDPWQVAAELRARGIRWNF